MIRGCRSRGKKNVHIAVTVSFPEGEEGVAGIMKTIKKTLIRRLHDISYTIVPEQCSKGKIPDILQTDKKPIYKRFIYQSKTGLVLKD